MWTGTQEEKDEHSRAMANLRKMKELEKNYRKKRGIEQEITAFGGIRTKYIKQPKSKKL